MQCILFLALACQLLRLPDPVLYHQPWPWSRWQGSVHPPQGYPTHGQSKRLGIRWMGHLFGEFGSSMRKSHGKHSTSHTSFPYFSSPFQTRAFICEQVLDVSIQDQLRSRLLKMKPRPSIYCPDFIAANQADRADNVLRGTKWEMVQNIRRDIKDFKTAKRLDKVRKVCESKRKTHAILHIIHLRLI